MYEISVTGRFTAAHHLRLPDGSNEPTHSHDWRVTLTLAGAELDGCEFLADFTEVQPRLDAILSELHKTDLHDVPAFAAVNPSAERVAWHVAQRFAATATPGSVLTCVEVEEAPGCIARYFPTKSS